MQIPTKRKLLTVPMHITKSSLRKDIYILEIKRGIYDIQEKKHKEETPIVQLYTTNKA